MKIDLFHYCMYCWIFQFCWCIECTTARTSFKIWNISAGISSSTLALLIGILPKAYLTWHSRITGWRWVATTIEVIQVIKTFFFFFNNSVYSCHLFLITSASITKIKNTLEWTNTGINEAQEWKREIKDRMLISILTIWWCPCVESSLVFLKESVCYVQFILLAKLC